MGKAERIKNQRRVRFNWIRLRELSEPSTLSPRGKAKIYVSPIVGCHEAGQRGGIRSRNCTSSSCSEMSSAQVIKFET